MERNNNLRLDIKAAHRLVSQQRAAGVDCEWDGWDIIFYRPAEHAVNSVDGAWRNGKYAFANRVVVNSEGIWEIDPRNIRRTKRAGNRRG